MAAVICNGIGSCCEFVCQIPCKVCSACSKGCGSGCSRLCASPLSAYVATVLVTQIPMIVFSLMEIGGIFRGCHGSYWLLGALLVAIVHVVVAFYASYRVTNGTDEKLREAGRHTAYERISFLLCRDPVVAVYIVVWFFYVGWLCLGSVWSVQGIMNDDEDENSLKDQSDEYVESSNNSKCNEDVVHNVMIVLGLGWAFFFLGPTVLLCVVCCACFSKKDYIATDEEFEAVAKSSTQEAVNNGSKKIDNNNNNANIRNPSDDIEAQQTASANITPRTYSVDGVPIEDVNKDTTDSRLKSCDISTATPSAPLEEEHRIPEVVAEQIDSKLKPPPATKVDSATPKANTDSSVLDTFAKSVGGWFSNGETKKTPKMEATLY